MSKMPVSNRSPFIQMKSFFFILPIFLATALFAEVDKDALFPKWRKDSKSNFFRPRTPHHQSLFAVF